MKHIRYDAVPRSNALLNISGYGAVYVLLEESGNKSLELTPGDVKTVVAMAMGFTYQSGSVIGQSAIGGLGFEQLGFHWAAMVQCVLLTLCAITVGLIATTKNNFPAEDIAVSSDVEFSVRT